MEYNELKKVFTENCVCYYFGDIIKIEDFGFDNILLDEKSYENILTYGISYETLLAAKPLGFMFNKVYGFIRDNLILFGLEKYNTTYSRIR